MVVLDEKYTHKHPQTHTQTHTEQGQPGKGNPPIFNTPPLAFYLKSALGAQICPKIDTFF